MLKRGWVAYLGSLALGVGFLLLWCGLLNVLLSVFGDGDWWWVVFAVGFFAVVVAHFTHPRDERSEGAVSPHTEVVTDQRDDEWSPSRKGRALLFACGCALWGAAELLLRAGYNENVFESVAFIGVVLALLHVLPESDPGFD